MSNTIFVVMVDYDSSIYSVAEAVSYHRTREGAQAALDKIKAEDKNYDKRFSWSKIYPEELED